LEINFTEYYFIIIITGDNGFVFLLDHKREYFNGDTYKIGKGKNPEEAFNDLYKNLKKTD